MDKPDRKLRVGVTISIRDGSQSVWENGIFQNCILLVQMFKQLPEVADAVLVHGSGTQEAPAGLMLAETGTEIIALDKAMETLDVVIEMSDQLPEDWVEIFRAKGGRFAAMKVGNEYFVDVERSIYKQPHAGLCSRKVYDAIWTLPQYEDCCTDYYSLNTRAPVRIVPHLWSPLFLEMGSSKLPAGVRFGYQPGRKHWRVCVFEPNLSMVKTSVIPMLACEEAYRANPKFPEMFRFLNTEKAKNNPGFVRFAQSLDIVKNGLSSFDGRFYYYEFMAHHGDCVVSHQWHNAQNYLYYETLYGGYPLVHNSPIIKNSGYYYPDFDCREAGAQLLRAFADHDKNLQDYKAGANDFLRTLDIRHKPNIDAYSSALRSLYSGESPAIGVAQSKEMLPIAQQKWPEEVKPVVTIWCVTYNHAGFIRDAMDRFLVQKTNFPVRIVMLDDASDDGTSEILHSYAEKYPGLIQIISQHENQWSKGNKQPVWDSILDVRSDYIALCEGDDYWCSSSKLQKQVEFLQNNPDLSMVFHDTQLVDAAKAPLPLFFGNKTNRPRYDRYDLLEACFIHTTSVLLRRSSLGDRVPEAFYRLPVYEWPLFALAAKSGDVGFIQECMSCYRQHTHGVWQTKTDADKSRGMVEVYLALQPLFANDPRALEIIERKIAQFGGHPGKQP